MKKWFASRTGQERRILLIVGVLIAVILLYWTFWRPFAVSVEGRYQSVQEKRALLAWMQQQTSIIQSLRGKATQHVKSKEGQSLLGLVSLLAKQKGLDAAIRRIQPTGEGEVQVWLEQVSFDEALAWLSDLTAYQIRIDNVVVRLGQAGAGVDLDLILKDA